MGYKAFLKKKINIIKNELAYINSDNGHLKMCIEMVESVSDLLKEKKTKLALINLKKSACALTNYIIYSSDAYEEKEKAVYIKDMIRYDCSKFSWLSNKLQRSVR